MLPAAGSKADTCVCCIFPTWAAFSLSRSLFWLLCVLYFPDVSSVAGSDFTCRLVCRGDSRFIPGTSGLIMMIWILTQWLSCLHVIHIYTAYKKRIANNLLKFNFFLIIENCQGENKDQATELVASTLAANALSTANNLGSSVTTVFLYAVWLPAWCASCTDSESIHRKDCYTYYTCFQRAGWPSSPASIFRVPNARTGIQTLMQSLSTSYTMQIKSTLHGASEQLLTSRSNSLQRAEIQEKAAKNQPYSAQAQRNVGVCVCEYVWWVCVYGRVSDFPCDVHFTIKTLRHEGMHV